MSEEIINCIHNDKMGELNAENALCLIDPDDKCCKDVEQRYCYYKQLQRLKQENEELRKFKKQLLHPVILPNIDEPEVVNKYKQALEEIRKYCEEQNLKADYTACEVLAIIDEVLDEN